MILKRLGLKEIWARWPLKGNVKITIADSLLVFYSNCDDYLISNMYYQNRSEEVEELDHLLSVYDRKSMITFLDIGSYNGLFSIAIGSRFQHAEIYAFEPNPNNYKRLVRNIELNKLTNTKTLNIGISDCQETLDFYVQAGEKMTTVSSFTKAFTERHTIGEIETVKVETNTLDHLFDDLSLIPDLIKIDVEGHELSVLNGGKRMLTKCKPTILCEIFTRKYQSEKEYQQGKNEAWQIDQLLKNLSYEIYVYSAEGFKRINTLNYDNPNRNYFLIHQENDFQALSD
jgi:FkbM family methyltransferase